jgi:hypothetical protein
VGPPAENGTISVIGRDGKLSARDEIGHVAATVPIAALIKSRRRMKHSPVSFLVVESHSTGSPAARAIQDVVPACAGTTVRLCIRAPEAQTY